MTIFFVAIFGLVIGSFLNVVISRLHSGGSVVFGRSHCVHCRHELGVLDLIPVLSFAWLKGRCRYCGKKISWQYPLVEILTSLLFVSIFLSLKGAMNDPYLWVQAAFACFFVVIGVFDQKHLLILDKVLLPFGVLAVGWSIYAGTFFSGLFSGLAVMAFFAFQYYLSRGTWIGFGDVKFGFVLGFALAWPKILVCLFLAYVIGAMTGLGLMAYGKKELSSQLPMGTYLSISAIISMFWGEAIAQWYFRLIGV